MPVATEAQAPVQPQYKVTKSDQARIEAIQRAREAYEGELIPPIKPMPDEPDLNVMGNEVQPAVDMTGSFVFNKEVGISVGESGPKEAQVFLDKVWGKNETRLPLLLKLHMNGEVAGRAFLRIVPNRDGSFRLVELDPAITYVKSQPQDCETVQLFCLEYCEEGEDDKGKETKVYYREEIARVDPQMDDPDSESAFLDKDTTWQIQHWSKVGDKGAWIPAGEPYIWPYAFPPIASCQNLPKPNSFWGYADVKKPLIRVNDALNFINSNINVTGKIQRILYAPGMETTVDVTPGSIVSLPLPENEIKAVNLQSDIANMRAFAGDLRGESETQTSVPMIAQGRSENMPSGNMSGIAIRLLFMSLLMKMEKQRCLYGALIIEVSKALLVLAGFSQDIDIMVHWQDPLPADSSAQAQEALVLSQLGVSKATLMRRLGFDPEEETRLNEEEDARALEAYAKGQGLPPGGLVPQEQEEGEKE